MKIFFQNRKKELLETLNSLAWFTMDAAWMLELRESSIFLIVPTVLTGLLLCFMERKKSLILINVSVFCWICMNVSWMLSEMYPQAYLTLLAKGFLIVGIISMVIAIYFSNNRSETIFHFKRSRIKNLF